jgi:hypothetical protein
LPASCGLATPSSSLYVKDNAGDENFNVYAVDPAPPGGPSDNAPALARSHQPEGRARHAVQRAEDRSRRDLHRAQRSRQILARSLQTQISTGERTLIRQNTDRIAAWIFDLQGNLRLAQRVQDSGDQEILRVDAGGFTPIYTCNVFETCDVIQFHKDARRAYIQTNKGDLDLMTLALLDPATGEIETVESDPLGASISDRPGFQKPPTNWSKLNTPTIAIAAISRTRASKADYRWLEAEISRQGNLGELQHARRASG